MITQRQLKKRGALDPEREKQLSAAGFEWDPFSARWDSMYRRLAEFQRVQGDCNVPAQWADDRALAHWVAVQRAAFKAGKMSASRIAQLERLGFAWSRVGRSKSSASQQSSTGTRSRWTADWPEMFEKLVQFKATKGHFAMPRRTPEERRLANWAVEQRILRRKGQLPPDQERALNDIGFDWDPMSSRWETMFSELLEFKRRHGHVNVAQHSNEYSKLAAWVAKQRRDRKQNRPILATRATRLDDLGFKWGFLDPLSWEHMFAALVEYKHQHGDCKVPQHWSENKRLGKWVNTLRTQFKRGKLSAVRKQQLDAIGFVWNTKARGAELVPS